MKPRTDKTSFGSITIDGIVYSHDVLIRLDGTIRKRKKKLSKKIYGTSHKISLQEAESIYQDGVEELVIGTGQFDRVELSGEAARFFDERDIAIVMSATPEAIKIWNDSGDKTIGLFHVTC